MKKTKIRCKNCGTVIKENDLSCPICHMVPDRTIEEVKEVEENIVHNSNNDITGKLVIAGFLIVGMILTFIGFMHMHEVTYCTNSDCTTKNLFILFLGLALTIASTISFIKYRNK